MNTDVWKIDETVLSGIEETAANAPDMHLQEMFWSVRKNGYHGVVETYNMLVDNLAYLEEFAEKFAVDMNYQIMTLHYAITSYAQIMCKAIRMVQKEREEQGKS
jgi:hypothetical protein